MHVLAAAVANSAVHVLAAAVADSDVHVLAAAVTDSDVHVLCGGGDYGNSDVQVLACAANSGCCFRKQDAATGGNLCGD